jgi:hypothetical protein
MGVKIHIFLTSALVGGEWSTSSQGRFNPRERAPGTHLIGGWVGPRAGLDDIENNLTPTATWTPSSPQPVAIPDPQYGV